MVIASQDESAEKGEKKPTTLSQVLGILKSNDPFNSEHLLIEEQGKQLVVPAFIEHPERIGFLKLAMQLTSTKQVSNKINNTFLEWIITLLSRS